MDRCPKSPKGKAEPKRSPARKPPKSDGARVRDLEKRLAESLKRETVAQEQQAAAAEILRVISSSPTDVQPVFEAIVESARRLCEATYSVVFLVKDGQLVLTAIRGVNEAGIAAIHQAYPRPVARDTTSGRSILDHALVHLPDSWLDLTYTHPLRDVIGLRSILTVPFFRGGQPFGALSVWRPEPKPFTDKQIALLQTFADQAVIAIENVRLFTELQASNRELTSALDTQTATSEILRVISTSPTDLQPVLEALARSAVRFCGAYDATLFQVDGNTYRIVAHNGPIPFPLGGRFPLGRGYVTGRSMLDRQPVHVPDLQIEAEEFPEGSAFAREQGHRTTLAVPLLREGEAIGTIQLRRIEASPFTDRQLELLKSFADQAVIAIENVRLFTELQASNRELTTALDTQTATSDILRVISGSRTDVQPVFDAIVQSAVRLLGAHSGMLTQVAGDQIELAAFTSIDGAYDVAMKTFWPRPLHSQGAHALAIRNRAPVNVADANDDARVPEAGRAVVRLSGIRSVASVPLLRQKEAIGTLAVNRQAPGGFTDDEIALLQTFADQAVIAIENVRLFKELEARNRDLMATSAILQVISSSPTNVQPVFDAIVDKAAKLGDGIFSTLISFDGELMRLEAAHNWTSEAFDHLSHGILPAPPSRALPAGRAILGRTVIHLPDIELDQEFRHPELPRAVGFRSVLSVPMLRDSVPLGAISVARAEPGPFSDNQIDLLKTFADQAVIAIENVRLFNETKEALEQQTATSEILRVIAASPTDVQPVFDAIVQNAVRLVSGQYSVLFRLIAGEAHVVAQSGLSGDSLATFQRLYPGPLTGLLETAVVSRQPVHTADMLTDPRASELGRRLAQSGGHRAILFVPLLQGRVVIGVLSVSKSAPLPFPESQIALLQTFADQAVIAIENVRLFTELEARTGELTRSVKELKALGEVGQAVSSSLDLETVLTTIVARAVQLTGVDGGVVFEYDEVAEEFELRASTRQGALDEVRRRARFRKGEGVVGRTAITHEPVQVADLTRVGTYVGRLRESLIEAGVRALLAVPMLREGHLIGSLVVNRSAPGDFPPETVDLLRTFAAQSALAIQNARLFHEIEDKSRQLQAASQHKSEFLANMSHELRTPLNAIIGFSEVLNERMFGELNDKQAEYLKDIYASGQHLLSLINDILDLSKIEAGRMELEAADFHLPSAIDNALILVRERATRRGITLGRTIDERLGTVRGDERKVKQVLLNLLSNALKFTPEGGRIDVRAAMSDGMAEIAVADTGVGIAPEDQEAIFEEFRQVGTADKKVEGTGLGLALSRKFIELHGGRIWVQSEVGHGSTFTFTLPMS